jgi:hypothetical protein
LTGLMMINEQHTLRAFIEGRHVREGADKERAVKGAVGVRVDCLVKGGVWLLGARE